MVTQALADGGFYRADESTVDGEINRWRPSIYMPRWASRLTLTVTDGRVQRLCDISRDDVMAEGITERDGYPIEDCWAGWHEPFAQLWDHPHGEGAWSANPWVAALTFTVHRQHRRDAEAGRRQPRAPPMWLVWRSGFPDPSRLSPAIHHDDPAKGRDADKQARLKTVPIAPEHRALPIRELLKHGAYKAPAHA